MKNFRTPALAVVLLSRIPALDAVEITLPPETARLQQSPLPGYELAVAHCFTCHSVDYVRTQPATQSRAGWKASVVKMQKTFGAPIPDIAVEPIAEYLVRTYGAERAKPPGPAPGGAGTPGPGGAASTR